MYFRESKELVIFCLRYIVLALASAGKSNCLTEGQNTTRLWTNHLYNQWYHFVRNGKLYNLDTY